MELDRVFVFATATVILGLVASKVLRKGFDPFEPVYLFLAGYLQLYVVQAISYREYALRARGEEVVTAANFRAFWALLVFLGAYYSGLGKRLAAFLPKAPRGWSPGFAGLVSPFLVLWGLVCSVITLRAGTIGVEDGYFVQFPMMMLVGGVMLLVTGRQEGQSRPLMTAAGVAITAGYSLIWMFNAKRSHALFGILAGVSAFYLPRYRRPSLPVLAGTGLACVMAVALAIGWRGTDRYEQTLSGFGQYLSEFRLASVLESLNMADRSWEQSAGDEPVSKETEEMGGFLLMMATVPEKSPYDYGASYLRIFSTFIPRPLWPDKPLYGREEWISAWKAGSERPREDNFTGPAIGLLGATQLNGGGIATAIVLAALGLMVRTAYDYYRFHADCPWAQVWWSVTYFNAWLMTANDDPFVWFYYVYGFSVLPPMAALWMYFRLATPRDGLA